MRKWTEEEELKDKAAERFSLSERCANFMKEETVFLDCFNLPPSVSVLEKGKNKSVSRMEGLPLLFGSLLVSVTFYFPFNQNFRTFFQL